MLLQNTDELSQFSPPDRILFSRILMAYNDKDAAKYHKMHGALTPQQQDDFIEYKKIEDKRKQSSPAFTTAYSTRIASSSGPNEGDEGVKEPKKAGGCRIS